ncbi:MAG: uracil-DNA glycosylase [Candidatus Diapherotrites archaeon]|jgi:uracil-DNA glycosylase|uniref:Uracil-DNA glycosylase n=1 Tax=Candidatus Iainarchaeum sp. TaxID=3101447 RepID=A0A8T5GFH8_9ARCH|nr:uracil-DNA glycosylase [Candidatus Diapherotrites archaeon]MBT7240969.1 uracil-DNA glycosylase [Candidatus Diapherotrites archaeon]
MEINESEKLANFKKEFFEHAKESSLYKNVIDTNGKIVFGRGSDNPKILFIGEAPGFSENEKGKPFVGRSGRLLDTWISELEIEKDFAIVNVVPIIPLKDNGIRAPTDEEINYFLPFTEKYIELLSPKVIVLLGRSAASIFDKNLTLGQIKHWKKTKLFFIYHPSYYLRKGGKGFEGTLKQLKNFLNDKTKQETLTDF